MVKAHRMVGFFVATIVNWHERKPDKVQQDKRIAACTYRKIVLGVPWLIA
jgi:hypothetical protein